MGSSYGPGVTVNEKVFLNVYDLHSSNDCLTFVGLGFYHSGVQIRDQEFSFGPEGVFDTPPRELPGMPVKFRQTIEIGSFEGNAAAVRSAIDELSKEFKPGAYHGIKRNCNSFAHALCLKLTGKPIPGFVNRLANIGAMFPLFWPDSLRNGPTASDDGEDRFQAFSGGSRTLSGPSSAPAPTTSAMVPPSVETDRMEMMRRQRLARFEQQQAEDSTKDQ